MIDTHRIDELASRFDTESGIDATLATEVFDDLLVEYEYVFKDKFSVLLHILSNHITAAFVEELEDRTRVTKQSALQILIGAREQASAKSTIREIDRHILSVASESECSNFYLFLKTHGYK